MKTLAKFKKEYEKKEIRVYVQGVTHWCSTIDETIKKLREIKKRYKNQIVEIELEGEYGYHNSDYPSISFYVRRKETKKEFDERMQKAYKWYIRNEEYNFKIYHKVKKELEK